MKKEPRKICMTEVEYRKLKRVEERHEKAKLYIKELYNLFVRTGKDVRVKAQ